MAAVSPPRRRRRRPGPARVPRRRGPADRRVVAGCPRHALHRPAVAGRRAARAAPAQDGRRRRSWTPARSMRMTTDRRRSSPSSAKPIAMSFPEETPLEDVIKYIQQQYQEPRRSPTASRSTSIPIGLQEAEKSMTSTVRTSTSRRSRSGRRLKLLLKQLDLTYQVKDGLLTITSNDSADRAGGRRRGQPTCGGMGGMGGGMGLALEQAQASGGARLNQAAASDQAEELRVADGQGSDPSPSEKDGPSVTFPIAGRLDIPSRRDPQLLEVARVELAAEYYAKAVPVLTPRVYRLAKLTNKSDFVLLPGEATVYVGGDFVGRMRLPLVAAGEPFIAGFGVDPQLQVSRRLVRKSRSVQGGNQIFDYEFRIGLRNYRPGPVKVQLWDRLPKPQGEAVAVNLVKTSAELSTDALYQRTARMDNLLRWDVERATGHGRRQDDVPELRVPPGIRPRPPPAPLRLRRPARRPHRWRRHGHGRNGRRHGRNAIGETRRVIEFVEVSPVSQIARARLVTVAPQPSSPAQPAGAVAEAVDLDPHPVEHRDVEVRQRRLLRVSGCAGRS